ncbi:MAG TPA: DUF4351 domain-containing protein [Chthonomonadaceae bacterium]|nr:DUF4351 domain-containing protein [Chthonomonadaceae bacterium]
MSGKPFDATTKQLIQTHPRDWLDYLGLPVRSVSVTEADVSTISADADKVLIVEADPPYIAHIELQSGYKPDDDERFLVYNVLVGRQNGLLVRTVVFLLRPEADGVGMHAPLQRQFPDELPYLRFSFRVVRMWEQPVEGILQSGVGLLPLAPLCNVTPQALPNVIRQMEQRIDAEAPEEAGELWTSTYILMGLRYPRTLAAQLLKGVRAMKESSTYQAILEEGEEIGLLKGQEIGRAEGQEIGRSVGKAEEARAILLRLGSKRFGTPNPATLSEVERLDEIATLEVLIEQILEVESWEDLLNRP